MLDHTIFITGGTGFIGSHVVKAALIAGYCVRMSIRKPEQAETITKYYPEYASKIETVILPDITKSESFKDALDNIDYIFHLASPMPGNGSDVRKDYVNPAVQGTEAILYAAMKFPRIKKVIIDSSALALLRIDALLGGEVDVKDNTGEVIPINLDMPYPEGPASHALKYSASKILAHQATRDFLKSNNPHYTLITFHPSLVIGHSLIQDSGDIKGSNAMVWQSLFSKKPTAPAAWVHVQDVADAHIKAIETSIESGKEFLLSGSKPALPWEETMTFVNSQYPDLGWKLQPPFEGGWKVDVGTANQTFHLEWQSKEIMVQEIIDQQLAFRKANSSV